MHAPWSELLPKPSALDFRVKAYHFKFDGTNKFPSRSFDEFVFFRCIERCFIHIQLSIHSGRAKSWEVLGGRLLLKKEKNGG